MWKFNPFTGTLDDAGSSSSGGVTSVSATDTTLTISPTVGDVLAAVNQSSDFDWFGNHKFELLALFEGGLNTASIGDTGGGEVTFLSPVLDMDAHFIYNACGIQLNTPTPPVACQIWTSSDNMGNGYWSSDIGCAGCYLGTGYLNSLYSGYGCFNTITIGCSPTTGYVWTATDTSGNGAWEISTSGLCYTFPMSVELGCGCYTDITLVNDLVSPGSCCFYGTDGGGCKGWYAQPCGGCGGCGGCVGTWQQVMAAGNYSCCDALPGTDQTYNLGLCGNEWLSVHAAYFYGDGSNLINLPQPGAAGCPPWIQYNDPNCSGHFCACSDFYYDQTCNVMHAYGIEIDGNTANGYSLYVPGCYDIYTCGGYWGCGVQGCTAGTFTIGINTSFTVCGGIITSIS